MCELWAAKLGVIIISFKYRLAPEHRLPAAYHDSIAALIWFQRQTQAMKKDCAAADPIPWLHDYADFSKIFVMGESAGGNIAHHVGMWAARAYADAENAVEIKIKGMILLYPFFGGEDRMPSEERGLSVFQVEQSDALWRLALPVGSNRDHPFCNPIAKGTEVAVSNLLLPPMLFVIAGRDLLRDKTLQYCEFLKKSGKEVEVILFEEEDHGFTHFKGEEENSVEVFSCISDFIRRNSGSKSIQ